MSSLAALAPLTLVLFLCTICVVEATIINRPCPELSPLLKFPCRCSLETTPADPEHLEISIDCDGVVFNDDGPQFPYLAPIISYWQRNSGQQKLNLQSFVTSKLPLRSVDFSKNAIRTIADKAFKGMEETLVDLRLADNLLGDSLNPIFSSMEFQVLKNLRVLDLSGNKIKGIEEGILKGCIELQEFYLDNNNLSVVPSNSLNGPNNLRYISLRNNNIAHLKLNTFAAQPSLNRIDLRNNKISSIEGGAFLGLNEITEIYLGGNRITKLNSDVFQGASSLHKLDLSENFIDVFPTLILRDTENLKVLNVSSNMIKRLDVAELTNLRGLQILDISRNGISTIPPGTFRAQKALKYLDLSLNSLRTIEDDALEGLDNLQTLIIRDNNILLIPGSALGRLPKLSNLYLDYNRIAALSSDILGSIEPDSIKYLSLSRNIIRELPAGSFKMFNNLIYLDLSSNSLVFVSAEMFAGLENSLMELKLSGNRLSNIGSLPLGLRNLRRLDLSQNNLAELSKEVFNGLDYLLYLNLSSNTHLTPFPIDLLRPLARLQVIDLSNTGIENLPGEVFANMMNLRIMRLSGNNIQEIDENTFFNLRNLTEVDLSDNKIMMIKTSSFVNVMNLRRLYLRGNQLTAFKGEMFNTGTGLEILDLSYNKLSYLFPSSFRIHPRLKKLSASNNKFSFFPAELIQTLQYLEEIDLSNNNLVVVDELDFARLPRLSKLFLAHNFLESVNEMAFHNSTQLQTLDLSHNKLERLGERTFEGLMRLKVLNLEANYLTEIPEHIFEIHRLHKLDHIDLSHNKFEVPPLQALQRQNFYTDSIDLSYNHIKELPNDDSVLINAKRLDLSYNPLSEQAVRNILGEPKIVRELNLAGTNIKVIPTLETPFLQVLNLSNNKIEGIVKDSFQRTTLLEELDLSNNQLVNLKQLSDAWPMLGFLKRLDLSNNSFELISQGDLENLEILDTLKIHNLLECSRIEKMAFKNLPNLVQLKAYNYPKLGYLDVQGILQELPTLESLDIEVKDSAVGADQIQPANHPRLKELAISGYRLRSISSSILAGLKSKHLTVALRNTSLSSLPPAILFPVPRSSKLDLDISGSMISALSPQLLTSFEDRRNSFVLKGLNTNPINCDCNSRTLRRWLPHAKLEDLRCVTPENLHGRLLIEIGDDELTCDQKSGTQRTKPPTTPGVRQTQTKVSVKSSSIEPDIIFSASPTTTNKLKTKPAQIKQAHIGNDDTVIIAIVGGVVAFIALLIIIVCIVRCKSSSPDYMRNHVPVMPNIPLSQGSIINGAPSSTAIYAVPPYAQSYATLPHKGQAMSASQMRLNYSTMNNRYPQPYIIYNSDDKNYS